MTTILCVDDDRDVTDLVCYALERAGFATLAASSGIEALRLARTARPALIILDVHLPDMDGFAILAALRTFSSVPVVMLTERSEAAARARGFGLGADDYAAKPFSPDVLVARVRALLARDGHKSAIAPPP